MTALSSPRQLLKKTCMMLTNGTVMALALNTGASLAQTPRSIEPKPLTAAAHSRLDQREIRAQLLPRHYTTLAAEIGAKIKKIAVVEGSSFKGGQLLVSFDCSLQQSQLDKAKAALGAAEKVWRINQRLRELNSVGKMELDVSEAEMIKARAELASNASVISKCTAFAPFSGRVAEQKVREQQFVQPGQPLLEILDDSILELEFIAPSQWLVWLKPGHLFQIQIDETGKTYPARLQRIGARVDPVSQSIKLSASIEGKHHELMAGMSGKVLMAVPTHQ